MGGRGMVMGQGRPGVVAVIDLNKVMNSYIKAKTIVEGLQKDGMAADTALRKDNAQIEALKEKLKDFKPGTLDFKRREEEITQRISDLKVRASIEQRDFQERQMKAMYVIYCEITDEVERYAQANGVLLVMDYPSEKVDVDQPATIQRHVQRPFVYQGGPDITNAVLDSLNQKAIASQPRGGAPGSAPTRTR
jgi:Skp family chaperone for outer membrane proteins